MNQADHIGSGRAVLDASVTLVGLLRGVAQINLAHMARRGNTQV